MTIKHVYDSILGTHKFVHDFAGERESVRIKRSVLHAFLYGLPSYIEVWRFTESEFPMHEPMQVDIYANQEVLYNWRRFGNNPDRGWAAEDIFKGTTRAVFELRFMREVFDNHIIWAVSGDTVSLKLPEFLDSRVVTMSLSDYMDRTIGPKCEAAKQ